MSANDMEVVGKQCSSANAGYTKENDQRNLLVETAKDAALKGMTQRTLIFNWYPFK